VSELVIEQSPFSLCSIVKDCPNEHDEHWRRQDSHIFISLAVELFFREKKNRTHLLYTLVSDSDCLD